MLFFSMNTLIIRAVWEMSCMLRAYCANIFETGYTNIPLNCFLFALPPSRKKVLPSFNNSDMESILNKPKKG